MGWPRPLTSPVIPGCLCNYLHRRESAHSLAAGRWARPGRAPRLATSRCRRGTLCYDASKGGELETVMSAGQRRCGRAAGPVGRGPSLASPDPPSRAPAPDFLARPRCRREWMELDRDAHGQPLRVMQVRRVQLARAPAPRHRPPGRARHACRRGCSGTFSRTAWPSRGISNTRPKSISSGSTASRSCSPKSRRGSRISSRFRYACCCPVGWARPGPFFAPSRENPTAGPHLRRSATISRTAGSPNSGLWGTRASMWPSIRLPPPSTARRRTVWPSFGGTQGLSAATTSTSSTGEVAARSRAAQSLPGSSHRRATRLYPAASTWMCRPTRARCWLTSPSACPRRR